MKHLHQHSVNTWKLIGAFTAVYLIWGSTYLAIHFAIQSIPPLSMLGARFGVAGLLLFGVLRIYGIQKPTRSMWKSAFVIGTLTLGVGTGAVAWAEMYVTTGIAALLVTTVPLWMVLLDWKWKNGNAPSGAVTIGLVLGAAGIVLLVNPFQFVESVSLMTGVGMIVVLIGAFSWSYGSLLSRDMDLPSNPFMSTAVQMVGGSVALFAVGGIRGEWIDFNIAEVTGDSWLALGYLFFFGSIVAFSSYVWLMKNAPSEKVATYAYVNPVVAVLLGWFLAGEALSGRIIVAMVILVSAVIVISRSGKRSYKANGNVRKRLPVWLRRENWMYALDRPALTLRSQEDHSVESAKA